jgi:hypothetical protein
MTFIERAVMFIGRVIIFISSTIIFISKAITFIKGTITFTDGAVMSIGGAIIFISKGSLAIRKLFKTAKARVVDNIKINRCNLRRSFIVYKLKGPLLLINSLISLSDYSVQLSL